MPAIAGVDGQMTVCRACTRIELPIRRDQPQRVHPRAQRLRYMQCRLGGCAVWLRARVSDIIGASAKRHVDGTSSTGTTEELGFLQSSMAVIELCALMCSSALTLMAVLPALLQPTTPVTGQTAPSHSSTSIGGSAGSEHSTSTTSARAESVMPVEGGPPQRSVLVGFRQMGTKAANLQSALLFPGAVGALVVAMCCNSILRRLQFAGARKGLSGRKLGTAAESGLVRMDVELPRHDKRLIRLEHQIQKLESRCVLLTQEMKGPVRQLQGSSALQSEVLEKVMAKQQELKEELLDVQGLFAELQKVVARQLQLITDLRSRTQKMSAPKPAAEDDQEMRLEPASAQAAAVTAGGSGGPATGRQLPQQQEQQHGDQGREARVPDAGADNNLAEVIAAAEAAASMAAAQSAPHHPAPSAQPATPAPTAAASTGEAPQDKQGEVEVSAGASEVSAGAAAQHAAEEKLHLQKSSPEASAAVVQESAVAATTQGASDEAQRVQRESPAPEGEATDGRGGGNAAETGRRAECQASEPGPGPEADSRAQAAAMDSNAESQSDSPAGGRGEPKRDAADGEGVSVEADDSGTSFVFRFK